MGKTRAPKAENYKTSDASRARVVKRRFGPVPYKAPAGFRLLPTVSNSSLLARRSLTYAARLAASVSGSLVPTGKLVDLVTPPPPPLPRSPKHPSPAPPPTDSGYLFGSKKRAQPLPPVHPPHQAVHRGPGVASGSSDCSSNCNSNSNSYSSSNINSSSGSQPPIAAAALLHLASGDGIVGHAVSTYRARMERATERIFLKKYVSKEFTQNPRRAREQLAPVMRKALDKIEDRPIVDRFVLHLDLARRTIRGEHVRQRMRKLPGQRAVDRLQRSWESKDYLHIR